MTVASHGYPKPLVFPRYRVLGGEFGNLSAGRSLEISFQRWDAQRLRDAVHMKMALELEVFQVSIGTVSNVMKKMNEHDEHETNVVWRPGGSP